MTHSETPHQYIEPPTNHTALAVSDGADAPMVIPAKGPTYIIGHSFQAPERDF